MLYGDECFLRQDGVEIDPKELQPLNIADKSCVWGIRRPYDERFGKNPMRDSAPSQGHIILSPIPRSFRLGVRAKTGWGR